MEEGAYEEAIALLEERKSERTEELFSKTEKERKKGAKEKYGEEDYLVCQKL